MASYDQRDQDVRNQYNAGRDIKHEEHNYPLYVPPKPPAARRIVPSLIGLVFFVLFFGGGLYFFLTVAGIISPTPDQALSHFCNDLQYDKLPDAYNLYSTAFQKRVSYAEFSNEWSKTFITSCYSSISNSSDESASGTIVIDSPTNAPNTYTVTLIKDGIWDWKIDDLK